MKSFLDSLGWLADILSFGQIHTILAWRSNPLSLSLSLSLSLMIKYCLPVEYTEKYPLKRRLLGSLEFVLYVFTNLSARAGCDTKSILKRSLTGLNSVFLLPNLLPKL